MSQHNCVHIGDISETQVMARLTKLGYVILKPWTHNSRYDFVIDDNGIFQRIQCKTGRLRCGSVLVRTCSRSLDAGGIRVEKSYLGHVDFIGVYCFELDKCYLIPIDKIPGNTTSLRVGDIPRTHVKFADKYLFAKDYEL